MQLVNILTLGLFSILTLLLLAITIMVLASMAKTGLSTAHQEALEKSNLSEFDKGFAKGAQGAVLTIIGTAVVLTPAVIYLLLP